MSGGWEFSGSARVMGFIAVQSARDRRRLLDLLQSMADHPLVQPDDLPMKDAKGRQHWLRFRDGYAVMFWTDHSSKELRITDVGFE